MRRPKETRYAEFCVLKSFRPLPFPDRIEFSEHFVTMNPCRNLEGRLVAGIVAGYPLKEIVQLIVNFVQNTCPFSFD